MFPETAQRLKTAAPLFSHAAFVTDLRRLSAHGGARRHLTVGRCLTAKVPPPRKPRERVEIPGLEMVTYGERMHYVPGLAKPATQHWERDYKDPRYYKSPPAHEMLLYKDKPCYVFNQRTSALEGNGCEHAAARCSLPGVHYTHMSVIMESTGEQGCVTDGPHQKSLI